MRGEKSVAKSGGQLEAAYLAATYRVHAHAGPIELRIGQANRALDQLLRERGVGCWAFVTAWNPGSRPLAREENDARQARLARELEAAGHAFLPGVGFGEAWQEDSLLVLGMAHADAVELGRRWGQNAVVWGELGKPAQLVWCSDPS